MQDIAYQTVPAILEHPVAPRLRARVVVIYNPTAGARRRGRLERVIGALQDLGCTVVLRPTRRRGDAEAFAREESVGSVDVIAVAGGDGTISEAANGLAGRATPLAIIPLGTANVLAHEIGLPMAPEAVARTIALAPARPMFVGAVNGRLFVQMAGAGFDAHVVEAVTPSLKRRLRKAAYVLMTFVQMVRFPFQGYQVHVDGNVFQAASVIVSNGRFYAGRFVAAPAARVTQASLQVVIFETPGALAAMRYGAALMVGRLSKQKDVRVIEAHEVQITGAAGEPVQGDGDTIGQLPADIVGGAGMIRLVMPDA